MKVNDDIMENRKHRSYIFTISIDKVDRSISHNFVHISFKNTLINTRNHKILIMKITVAVGHQITSCIRLLDFGYPDCRDEKFLAHTDSI